MSLLAKDLIQKNTEDINERTSTFSSSATYSVEIKRSTPIYVDGKFIGKLKDIKEEISCDCPFPENHTGGSAYGYAFTRQLSGGEYGVICSGNGCQKDGKKACYIPKYKKNNIADEFDNETDDNEFTLDMLEEKFSMSKEDLDKMATQEVDIMDGIIFEGQIVTLVARPNGGKTLLAKTWSIDMAKRGYRVIYIYEDADMKGYKSMVDTAYDTGFTVISSFANTGTTPDDILKSIERLANTGQDLSKVVFVLDTLKKFTEVLDKGKNKQLFSLLRTVATKGASILLLAHANKYLDDNGNLIYEGTGDMLADIDAMYYLYDDGNKQEEIERFGTVIYEKGRAVSATKNVSYRFDLPNYSATKLDDIIDTRRMALQQQIITAHSHEVEIVLSMITENPRNQKELLDVLTEEVGMVRRSAIEMLHVLDGKIWITLAGGATGRSKIYTPLYDEFENLEQEDK